MPSAANRIGLAIAALGVYALAAIVWPTLYRSSSGISIAFGFAVTVVFLRYALEAAVIVFSRVRARINAARKP